MAQPSPLRARASLAAVLLGILIALDVVLIISDLMQIELLSRMAERAAFTMDEATANDERVRVISIVYILAFVVCAVTFLRWFHGAVARAVALDLIPSISPSSAVWSFFIPFVNLFRPYQTMKMLWQAGAPPGDGRGGSWPIVSLWWAGWLGTNLSARIATSLTTSAGKDARGLVNATVFNMVHHTVDIAAATLAILVIRGVTARQESLKSSEVAEVFD